MGVQGLWELLAPVGRRVSVETLAGKKLAIDASIWMVQFMKAMRDEKGEMVRNAHLLGFFRRICKLLFLRTKPVFVFDGATPVLKRRTVIARRRQRDNAQAKVRKIAEKLLLNQLKTMKLKELVKDIEKLKQKQKTNAKGEKILLDQTNGARNQLEADDMTLNSSNQDKIDEMLAASIQAEEDRRFGKNASTSAAANTPSEYDNEEEEMILLAEHDEVDPAVLAALPQSMQQNLLAQLKGKKLAVDVENRQKQDDDAKGKKTVSDETDMFGCTSSDGLVTRSDIQEKLDEMLAASIVAEENRSLANSASKSVAYFSSDEEVGKEYEDEDELEEMMLPAMTGEFDPNVLAALPPSMQLDLLVQMREKLMAENRQKYQKVKKDPAKFSELQIQAYLKTVAFRREIDGVQKSAAGRGVGGVQTSRIASEANREFIFSSSFTGDKHTFSNSVGALTSTGAQKNGDKPQETHREHPSQESINAVASASKSNTMTGSDLDESRRAFDDNIETYLDERGHVRVSRVRAMGIRMTRDLQRNLDLMKEVEQESASAKNISKTQTMLGSEEISGPRSFPCKSHSVEASHNDNSESVNLNERSERSMLKYDSSIEISFGDDGENKCFDGDDDLFACLAAGDPVEISSADNAPSSKQPSDLHSCHDWVEGITKEKGNSLSIDGGAETKPSLDEGSMSDESDMEWEEGVGDFHNSTSLFPSKSGRTVSKGHLEEEADLQEAIRRSLGYVGDEKSDLELAQAEKNYGERVHKDVGLFDQEHDIGEKLLPGQSGTQENESFCEIADGLEKPDCLGGVALLQTAGPSERQLMSSRAGNSDNSHVLVNNLNEKFTDPSSKQSMQDATERGSLDREMPCAESVTPLEKDVHVIAEHLLDTSIVGSGFSNSPRHGSEVNSHIPDAISAANTAELQIVDKPNDAKAIPVRHFADIKDSTDDLDFQQKLATERKIYNNVEEKEQNKGNSPLVGNENSQVEVTEGYLGEEMQLLGEEYLNLGDEQRKLERNAESVSSEMFVECQELLQMFGLPYIIAPMEAEAQCAYMELANLVDGVVTDDSDVFLFGARSVYKNIFDDRKYVETYFMKDIEKELGLTREKLIRMALLLGSDYTEGVSGIGIVNAIEVVNAFPEEDGLRKFREWIESPDPTILKTFDAETGSSAKKRGQKASNNGLNCSKSNTEFSASGLNMSQTQQEKQSTTYVQDIKQIFMDKHRNVSKNWHIPSSFPSEAVISAYSSPQVDKSTEPFTWGKPDHFVLRKLCWEKFGWANQKADELLVPVLKEYDKHETQLRLEAFYTFNERFAQIRSKRIKKAVKGITGNQTSELMDGPLQEGSKTRKKRKLSPVDKSKEDSEKLDENDVEDHRNYNDKSTADQSKIRVNARDPVSSIETSKKPPLEVQGRRSQNRGSQAVGRSKGRGRGRGTGRERVKKSSSFEPCKSSNDDSDDDGQEVLPQKLEGPDKVRRSMRVRKPVNYTVNDFEAEDVDISSDQSDKKCSDEEAVEQEMSSAHVVREDAAAGYSEKQQHNAGYSAIGCLPKDYIEVGGGFCTDEGETQRPDVGQFRDPSLEAEFSKDYLKMGGGFCSDEGEPKNEQDGTHATASAAALGNADVSHRPAFPDKADADNGPDHSYLRPTCTLDGTQEGGKMDADDAASNAVHPNSGRVSDRENTKDSSGMIPVGSLSAMPFLKRKRRKG